MADTGKRFSVRTPPNGAGRLQAHGLALSYRISWDGGFSEKWNGRLGRAQAFVDQECIRRMSPDTPFLNGVLRDSATYGTVIGSGVIRQDTPYARRQYYRHKERSRWFERMKNRDRDVILKGAKRVAERG